MTLRIPTVAAASSTRRAPSTLTRAISASSGIGSTTDARCSEHVGARQHRGQVAARDVDEADVDPPHPPGRLAHIEADDLPIGGQAGQKSLGDQPGGSRNGDGGHVHRLAAWCTPLKATTIEERRDPGRSRRPRLAGLPGFPFGAPDFPGLPASVAGGIDLTQLMGMLSSPGPVNWEIARQIARSVALEDGTEVPPSNRNRTLQRYRQHHQLLPRSRSSCSGGCQRDPRALIGRTAAGSVRPCSRQPGRPSMPGT